MCQTRKEGYAAFQQFKLASRACKPPCKQLSINLQYAFPWYLHTQVMPNVTQYSNLSAYYLFLPSLIKVSRTIPSYGFVSYIAEVSGWYNFFLEGSAYAFCKLLWIWINPLVPGKFFLEFLHQNWCKGALHE